MGSAIVIPARYRSSRFPGKVLAPLAGRPMIRHVWERAMAVPDVERVIVATDDATVAATAKGFGAEVMMTSDGCQSGTDRVAEAAAAIACDIIVNLQGDLPLIPPRLIIAARQPLLDDPTVMMSTLKRPMTRLDELRSPNTVKVVTDRNGDALYFSRAPIPMARDLAAADPLPAGVYFHHMGLYVYRKSFLTAFAKLPPGRLEQLEQLEQLRALEHGYRIRVVEVDEGTVEVNAPDDLVAAEAAYHGRG
ncbi:MAG: 3-deoxy-manno-octulosonate cytidylyltransferase [Nitrospirae bacterium]|nr:3-deoxy-manno-octulosonate cytidylyltransferase [Nitrospirota bacterium]